MAIVNIDARKNRQGDAPITNTQREMIQLAADDAENAATIALGVLDAIWNQSGSGKTKRQNRKQAWSANAYVIRWFGSDDLSNDEIRDTRRRLRKIQEEFDDEVRFTIIQEQTGKKSYRCNNNVDAYCSPGTPVKVCLSFFAAHMRRDRARFLIHELGHKNWHLVHHNGAAGSASAQQLAIDDSREARHNSENHAGFCNEYYTRT